MVLVVVVDVVSVGVDVDDVSVGVVVVAVVSVDAGAETADVSVVPDEDVLLPAETLPRAPAARRPMTNKAAIPTAVHDFFCGPPFFASGAIYSPSLIYAAQSTYNCRRVDARIPQ